MRVGGVVSGRDGDQQAAGNGNAARNGSDEPDPECQPQAHRIGHGDTARKQRELLQGEGHTGQNGKRRRDLEIVARRVGPALECELLGAVRDGQRVAVVGDGLLQIGDIEAARVRDCGAP